MASRGIFDIMASMDDEQLSILLKNPLATILAKSARENMKLANLLMFFRGLSSAKMESMLKSPFGNSFVGSDVESTVARMPGDEFGQCFDIMAAMDDGQLHILLSSALAHIFAKLAPQNMKLTDLLTFLGGLSGAKSELMLMSPFGRAFAGSDAESSSISVHADEFRQCFDIMVAMDDDQLRILLSSALVDIFAKSAPKNMKLADLLAFWKDFLVQRLSSCWSLPLEWQSQTAMLRSSPTLSSDSAWRTSRAG